MYTKIVESFYKEKNPLELVADLFVLFMFVMIVLVFSLNAICNGWDEGSGTGTCSLSGLNELYNSVMMIGTIMSFTGIIWIWLIPVSLVIKSWKVAKLGLINFVKKYPVDVVVYLPVIGLFIFLIWIIFF